MKIDSDLRKGRKWIAARDEKRLECGIEDYWMKALRIVGVGIAVFLGVFVWPTQYRYDQLHSRGGTVTTVRTNRFTGATEFLTADGWIKITSTEPKSSIDLSPQELGNLQGQATISSIGSFEAQIYNGTEKSVDEITISIHFRRKDGAIEFTREYVLKPDYQSLSGPRAATKYSASLGFTPRPDDKWDWVLIRAKGH